MIEIEQLTKRFGLFTAVDGISFDVEPGQVLGFLGPNGAGKSTTMKMITGFLAPTSGQVRVCGHKVEGDARDAKRVMGYLPEGAPSYGEMTVAQFLSFIADVRLLKGAERKQRTDSVIEQLNLQAVINQPVETLSKGFKRRVGMAQAILHDPQVLIMDEPTAGLDPNQVLEVRKTIKDLGKTILLSTHILQEVPEMADRIILIDQGRLIFDGTPNDLKDESSLDSWFNRQTA